MSPLGTRRRRSTTSVAALLLVLQGLAGSVAPLAHASERLTAPAHIEAQHSSSCIPLHDGLRCALCHYAGTRVLPQPVRVQPVQTTRRERRPDRADCASARGPEHLTAPPRAPPTSRS